MVKKGLIGVADQHSKQCGPRLDAAFHGLSLLVNQERCRDSFAHEKRTNDPLITGLLELFFTEAAVI